jgi:hypothetical protein
VAIYNGFADQLKAFKTKALDERAEPITRKIIFDVSTALVLKSPVGDPKYWKSKAPPGYVGGRFRANWQYGYNRVNRLTTEDKDKSGSSTIGRLVGSVPEKVLGNVHFITNSLPYANPLEEGWSWRQAPAGMVQVTILEFDPIVARAVAEFAR